MEIEQVWEGRRFKGECGRISEESLCLVLLPEHSGWEGGRAYYLFVCLFVCLILVYLFLAVLGLHCCTQTFSSCGEQGLLFIALCGDFSCCGAQALGVQASVVVAHRLSSCGSWALECRLSSCGAWA